MFPVGSNGPKIFAEVALIETSWTVSSDFPYLLPSLAGRSIIEVARLR